MKCAFCPCMNNFRNLIDSRKVSRRSMAFFAFLGALFPLYVAVYAQPVQSLISIFAVVALDAYLFAIGVGIFSFDIFMMAIDAFQTLFFMNLMRHLDRANLAFIYLSFWFLSLKRSGCFCYGDDIGRFFLGHPGIEAA